MLAAESTTNLTIPALISGAVALISPGLALARWIQEKSRKHRSRDEIQRSRELFEFIQMYPKLSEVACCSGADILTRAHAELAQSINRIDDLLEKRALKATAPREMAWPRRLLLLYAPRSWVALILHVVCHLVTAFSILAVVSLGNNEETDSFRWSEYLRYLHNPLFWIIFSSYAIHVWLLWYATVIKDQWDGTLPIPTAKKFFLMQVPASIRELIARMFLVWSLLDLATSVVYRASPTTQALKAAPLLG
jgi:hypothetical protein